MHPLQILPLQRATRISLIKFYLITLLVLTHQSFAKAGMSEEQRLVTPFKNEVSGKSRVNLGRMLRHNIRFNPRKEELSRLKIVAKSPEGKSNCRLRSAGKTVD